MNRIDTSKRTNKAEIMDDFDLKGEELKKTLYDLDNINKWLGGNQITLKGVKKLLKDKSRDVEYVIVDVGCGNGAILREVAKWGRKEGYKLKLTGIDANPYAIEIAYELSGTYKEIDFKAIDIFGKEFSLLKYDILLCTLTLHHFKDSQVLNLMQLFTRQSQIGVVINDLHRSSLAYRLFQAFCAVFINNEIARKDGLTSILRGFKRKDLEEFAEKIPAAHQEIKWKWAFRFQWIIQK